MEYKEPELRLAQLDLTVKDFCAQLECEEFDVADLKQLELAQRRLAAFKARHQFKIMRGDIKKSRQELPNYLH